MGSLEGFTTFVVTEGFQSWLNRRVVRRLSVVVTMDGVIIPKAS